MKMTEPQVYLIASTQMTDESYAWLSGLGGERCLDHVTGSDAEQLIELAARRCYKSFVPGLNPNVKKVRSDSAEYHANILEQKHGSVLEHSSCTFAIEYVSRVFTHELVRHRVGFAYSQESLRYVRLTELGFNIPDCIRNNGPAMEIFVDTIRYLEEKQRQLADIFDIEEMKDFDKKKVLTSAFRRIAPIGLSTGIVSFIRFWLRSDLLLFFSQLPLTRDIVTQFQPLLIYLSRMTQRYIGCFSCLTQDYLNVFD